MNKYKIKTIGFITFCMIWCISSNGQTIVSANPDNANRGANLSVTISGQNTAFNQGTSTIPIWFQQGTVTIYPNTVSCISATVSLADFTIPSYASLGLYDIIVVDPVSGLLTKNDGFEVTDPCGILAISMYVTDESGFNFNDGTVTVSGLGGLAPYWYYWTGPNNYWSYSPSITGLEPGVYTLSMEDANYCYTWDIAIVQAYQCVLTGTVSSTNESASNQYDGTAAITANGVSPYTYSWSTMATTSSISNLTSGIYYVTITDAAGCSYSTATAVNTSGLGCTLSASATGTNESQSGANDGSAIVSASLGTEPYTYLWSNSGITPSISGLPPADYTVIVMDAGGCYATATYTVVPGLIIGIDQMTSPDFYVTVYPNPATDVVNFEIIGADNMEVHIYDVAGKHLAMFIAENQISKFNSSKLTGGIYFYQIIDSDKNNFSFGKFIIKK